MKTTHVISIKSNGREIGIVTVNQDDERWSCDAIEAVEDLSPDDRMVANGIMFGLSKAMDDVTARRELRWKREAQPAPR